MGYHHAYRPDFLKQLAVLMPWYILTLPITWILQIQKRLCPMHSSYSYLSLSDEVCILTLLATYLKAQKTELAAILEKVNSQSLFKKNKS